MPASIEPLLEAAEAVSRKAHAPYSKFRVGAALITPTGEVFTGCNVENASYGLTICAERNAVFAAVAAGFKEFSAIAVVSGKPPLPAPCGACRQVLAEFCGPELPVYAAVAGKLNKVKSFTLGGLLPETFRL